MVRWFSFGCAEEMGLIQQATLFQAGFKAVRAHRPQKKAKEVWPRSSASCAGH